MISLQTFRRIKELKEQGIRVSKILVECKISKSQYYKWGLLDEETFMRHIKSRAENGLYNYKDFIISIISITPQINDTAIMYRCIEEFSDFDIPRMTFFRYVKKIREESGYVKEKRRIHTITKEVIPGYEAQVDFGQMKMKDMYDKNIRVYFFCMVLSFSRMKSVYFSIDPFTSKSACLTHDYAFKYFGGRPQSILYDQDRLFLVSENYRDFILTNDFGDYVKDKGFTVRFCHKHDPESKAKVEAVVHTVKSQFLKGRVYAGIDSLNGAAIEWLDRFGNGDYHHTTKKIPREVFKEESKALTKVKTYIKQTTFILTVGRDNSIKYKGNRYVVNPLLHLSGCRVKIVVDDNKMKVYRAVGDEFIAEYDLLVGEGYINTCKKVTEKASIYPKIINNLFGQDKNVEKFIEAMKKLQPDYFIKQTRRFVRMTRFYTKDELYEGIMYCLKKKKETIMELSSYLIYKYGQDRGKMYLKFQELYQYTRRSKEIKEEIENAGCKRNKGNG